MSAVTIVGKYGKERETNCMKWPHSDGHTFDLRMLPNLNKKILIDSNTSVAALAYLILLNVLI